MAEKQHDVDWDDPIFHDAVLVDHKADYVMKDKMYAEQSEDSCVICRIIKKEENVPRYEIYRNDHCIVILNLYPYQIGHVLISPLDHVIGYHEFSEKLIIEFGRLTQKAINVLNHFGRTESFNIGWNQGPISGGSIRHFHIHLVPRYRNELNFMEIIARTKPFVMSLEQVEAGLLRYQPYFNGTVDNIEQLKLD